MLQSLLFSPNKFSPFGPSHLTVLALSLLLAWTLIKLARTRHWAHDRTISWSLGLTIFSGEVLLKLYPALIGKWSPTWDLPLHICDIIAFLALPALVTHNRFLIELVYYWGLSGTLLATLTPALTRDFPNLEFFCFFASHALVVVAASYLVFGLRLRPRRGAWLRVFGAIQIYGCSIAAVNYVLKSNYLFLCHKPIVASPFDYLGPWPYYVIVADLLFLGIFRLLNIPFYSNFHKCP